jgi:tetratricopeptide (TPR) repeat protein
MHLDDLSNRVVDAIERGRFARAEKLCRRLLREYPKMFDGHQRLAMLRAAQGRYEEAAKHYEIVLGMMRKNPLGIDKETIAYVTERRDEALKKAQASP